MDAEAWDQRYAGTDLVWSAGPNQFVEEIFGSRPPARVVDLACGEGRNAIWLAERGWQVTAVDFSAVAVARGRELAAGREVDVTWVHADATDHAFETASTDAILVCYLQLPADELHRALVQARDAITSGGEMVVIAHARDNLEHGVGGPQDPEVLPTPDQIVASLDGMTIERAGHALRPVETSTGTRDAIDVVVIARQP